MTIVVWNVADNHFVEPVTASMQQICALGSQFRLNSRVVSGVIKSQPEGVGLSSLKLKGCQERQGAGNRATLQAIKSVITL